MLSHPREREIAKAIIGFPCAGVHVASLRLQRRRPSAILCYHSIAAPASPGRVTPQVFHRQIHWLRENQRVLPLVDVLRGAEGVALTFDDAYTTVADAAAPLLAEHQLPYTVAVPVGRVGERLEPHVPLSLPEHVMAWDALGKLPGHVTFASHLMTHRAVQELTDAELADELRASRSELARRFPDRTIDVVIWPYGDGGDRATGLAREAGYCAALAGGWGVNPKPGEFEYRRVGVDDDDGPARLWAKIAGGWNWINWARPAVGVVTSRR